MKIKIILKKNFLIFIALSVIVIGMFALSTISNKLTDRNLSSNSQLIQKNQTFEQEIKTIQTQSPSDNINDIEKDLNDTNLDDVDKELQDIEKEINETL